MEGSRPDMAREVISGIVHEQWSNVQYDYYHASSDKMPIQLVSGYYEALMQLTDIINTIYNEIQVINRNWVR